MDAIMRANVEMVIDCHFVDTLALYKAYMPFLHGGGIFLETIERFALGDELKLKILFKNDSYLYKINTKVVWITPSNTHDYIHCGIGVQFLDNDHKIVCNKIEILIANMADLNLATATM